jgi:hypothetical protein
LPDTILPAFVASGAVLSEGVGVDADLYVVDTTQETPIATSSAVDGSYSITDPGDRIVIPDSSQLVLIADGGSGARPKAYGEVVPDTIVSYFSPADITTLLWLDAADSSTLTVAGGVVSQWADKSGNDRHAGQTVGTDQPALNAGALNGLDVLSFDGTDDTLFGDWTTDEVDLTSTVFMVFRVAAGEVAWERLLVLMADTTNRVQLQVICQDTDYLGVARNYEHVGGFASPFGNWRVGVFHHDPPVDNGGAIYTDGELLTTKQDGTTYAGTGGTTNGQYVIGSRIGEKFCQFDVAEILVVPGGDDPTLRQKIEGYLAHKWGLDGNLVASHDHKAEASFTNSYELTGTVTLDGVSAAADLYLVDLAVRTADATTVVDGTYSISTNAASPLVLADYGAGIRPLVHGPIEVSSGDIYWSNVSLLLPFDGSIEDVSSNNLAISGYGGIAVSTAESVWGGSSLAFDGATEHLSLTPEAINDSEFTIEFWVRPDTVSSGWQTVYDSRTALASANGTSIHLNDDILECWSASARWLYTPPVLAVGVWAHVALVRNAAGQFSLFVDGVSQASSTEAKTLSDSTVRIGRNAAGTEYFSGYLDDYRITTGVCRYNSDFTPPTAAFPTSG